jgi:hypothetical protein
MNWHERIEAAKRNNGFSEVDVEFAKEWVTCACGEQDTRLPRDSKGQPLDTELAHYGADFFGAVYRARTPFGECTSFSIKGTRIEEVESWLATIERRAEYLINGA